MKPLLTPLMGVFWIAVSAFGALPAAEPAPDRGWDYVVRIDEGLGRAHVRCCFRNYPARRLVSSRPEALGAFTFPAVEGDASLSLRASDNSVLPRGLSRTVTCVNWSVDLDALGARGRRGHARRVGRDMMLTPGAVLLRPAVWPADARVSVRFELPKGYRAAVPWAQQSDGSFRLGRFATWLLGKIAIGRFTPHRERVAGTNLELVVLDAPHAATDAGIRAWIVAAVKAVAPLVGRFPSPRLLVMVDPVPGRNPPVAFGMAMRAGGGHVHILLGNAAKDEALPGEWVGVHEMSHLALPWTAESDVWLQEGFATYYQEVLRARAGMLTEQEVWQNIHEGFGRGRRSGGVRPLEIESRSMKQQHLYHRVYWAGAAIAFLIDIELRRQTERPLCLDDVIRYWHRSRGTLTRAYGALELLRAADRYVGSPHVTRIAEAWLAESGFPDIEPAFERLGIRVHAGIVSLDDKAPEAALRRALMAPTKR